MGGFFGKLKFQNNKCDIPNIQICPTKSRKEDNKSPNNKMIQDNNPNIENSPQKQWIDAELIVPDSILEIERLEFPPIPPPRKKYKKQLVTEISKSSENNLYSHVQPNNIPVEEPIIIPKKQPVHICDGTHHHVINTFNGNILHHPKETKIETANNNEVKKSQISNKNLYADNRNHKQKNLSTVSLPDFGQLKIELKNKWEMNNLTKEKPVRNISVISLPTESKITLSQATTARLESYMKRCKSFNNLPPMQLLEKLQDNEHHSDSEDSWDGINDWGMDNQHKNIVLKSPVEPKCRLDYPSSNRNAGKISESYTPGIKEEHMKHGPHALLKNITERRESIDDFFDAKASSPYQSSDNNIKPNISLGRRGSDSFFTEIPTYTKNNTEKPEIAMTKLFLEKETQIYEPYPKLIKNPKKLDEKKTSNSTIYQQTNDYSINENNNSKNEKLIENINLIEKDKEKIFNVNPVKNDVFSEEDKKELINTFEEFYNTHEILYPINKNDIESNKNTNNKKNIDEINQSNNTTHSNLLKIIQQNSDNDNKVDEDMKFMIPEPLRTALIELDEKINQIDMGKQEKI